MNFCNCPNCQTDNCPNADKPYSTVALPDGVVIGGPWPTAIIAWPNGNSRRTTKPEYDLFQALERLREELAAHERLMVGHVYVTNEEWAKVNKENSRLREELSHHQRRSVQI